MSEATRTWLPSGASPTIRVHGRGSKTTASGLATLSFLTHSRQHATRISPSDCTGANPRSCKINWKAVGTPRKVVPNGEGRRGLHIIMIHSSQEPSPKVQTPTKQQGSPQNPGKPTPKRGKRGKKGGDQGSRPGKGKTKQGRGTKAHPGSAQAAPIFLAWYRSRPVLCPGGGCQRPRQLSPPRVRCASVPDGRSAG